MEARLCLFVVKNTESLGEQKACIICLEAYKIKDILKVSLCDHVFHRCCFNNWLKNKNCCPICRKIQK